MLDARKCHTLPVSTGHSHSILNEPLLQFYINDFAPLSGEAILTKHRVNAFIGTPLDLLLRNSGISRVAVVGCSTDVGVQTTARAAHDLDYACTVIGDCCIAPSDEDHAPTLRMLTKVANVISLEQFING
jgi:nicotinamidase-related amidase